MKPSSRRVVNAFLSAPGHRLTTHQLCQPTVGGIRFSARLKELRDAGCEIDSRRTARSGWTYTLRWCPIAVASPGIDDLPPELRAAQTPAGSQGGGTRSDAPRRPDSDPTGAPITGGELPTLFPREKPPHDSEQAA